MVVLVVIVSAIVHSRPARLLPVANVSRSFLLKNVRRSFSMENFQSYPNFMHWFTWPLRTGVKNRCFFAGAVVLHSSHMTDVDEGLGFTNY